MTQNYEKSKEFSQKCKWSNEILKWFLARRIASNKFRRLRHFHLDLCKSCFASVSK